MLATAAVHLKATLPPMEATLLTRYASDQINSIGGFSASDMSLPPVATTRTRCASDWISRFIGIEVSLFFARAL